MPSIKLYELGPTRSARVHWTLKEADLSYESIGNTPDIIGSAELKKVHPLGKLPAAIIDGRPLFESAAIAAAIADLAPQRNLIAKPGTWSRALHDQWVLFALTEMEPWLWSIELNTTDFIIPKEQHVPSIVAQNKMMFDKSATALDAVLGKSNYLVEDRFTVTDIIVAYTINWSDEYGLLSKFQNLVAYLERLYQREHCPLKRHAKP
jgi:glutathione S-transferase